MQRTVCVHNGVKPFLK